VTAGNSSPLTDGASAVLLMSEEAARAQGRTPVAYIRAYAIAAVDPGDQLLMGPVFAIPRALERAGISRSVRT
jgi:acetyl-CoA acyltransferase